MENITLAEVWMRTLTSCLIANKKLPIDTAIQFADSVVEEFKKREKTGKFW